MRRWATWDTLKHSKVSRWFIKKYAKRFNIDKVWLCCRKKAPMSGGPWASIKSANYRRSSFVVRHLACQAAHQPGISDLEKESRSGSSSRWVTHQIGVKPLVLCLGRFRLAAYSMSPRTLTSVSLWFWTYHFFHSTGSNPKSSPLSFRSASRTFEFLTTTVLGPPEPPVENP